jgi:hypothetical protein
MLKMALSTTTPAPVSRPSPKTADRIIWDDKVSDAEAQHHVPVAFIRFLALTGARRGEAEAATW